MSILVKTIRKIGAKIPGVRTLRPFRVTDWVEHEYTPFTRSERKYLYMSAARFLNINRPIPGYYFEFGCHEANTMRMAWRTFQHLFDLKYVAFDSFEGLPEMEDFDRSTVFVPGNLQTSENEFIRLVTNSGMPKEKLKTVKGFYDKSLTKNLSDELLPTKAAVVYIDCDLYDSTVPVLKFIRPFLQKGTIIFFDDWNCFHADPNMGERRAWREFLSANPDCEFVDFVSTGEAMSFICVKA